MRYKTSENDFLFFKQECRYWLNVLGLISWSLHLVHENCGKNLADCSTHYTAQSATIRLNTSWNIKPTKNSLQESAIHEVLEILLSPLYSRAKSRVWDEEDYEKEHHRIIRTVTFLLLKQKK